jgi:hypothetical protein
MILENTKKESDFVQKEDLIQATGIKLIKKLCPKCIISQSLSGINLSLFEKLSIPNNIKARLRIERNKEIARLKATGWVKGIPDITVFCPKGIVVFFEFKTSNGKQSKEQKEIENQLYDLGFPNYYLISEVSMIEDIFLDLEIIS